MSAVLAPSVEAPFSGSYAPADVALLLKPARLAPTDLARKERLIQSGARHYSEMVGVEPAPDAAYIRHYERAVCRHARRLGGQVTALSEALAQRRGGEIVLASLVRAGVPLGVLLARALRRAGRRVTHYGVSIIRERGVDAQALSFIRARHRPADVVFVDGWTGKGAIAGELRAAVTTASFGAEAFLTVLADPGGHADLAATPEDQLVPSGMLGAIGSGLISRSVLNSEVVGPSDFHACVHHRELAAHDRSAEFVDAVDSWARSGAQAPLESRASERPRYREASSAVDRLMRVTNVGDRNRVKPGIAEAGRALLRGQPERLFLADPEDLDVAHLLHLARVAGVPVDQAELGPYRAATIIRTLGQD